METHLGQVQHPSFSWIGSCLPVFPGPEWVSLRVRGLLIGVVYRFTQLSPDWLCFHSFCLQPWWCVSVETGRSFTEKSCCWTGGRWCWRLSRASRRVPLRLSVLFSVSALFVILWHEADRTFSAQKSSKAAAVLQQVFSHLNLVEVDFFGLRFCDDRQRTVSKVELKTSMNSSGVSDLRCVCPVCCSTGWTRPELCPSTESSVSSDATFTFSSNLHLETSWTVTVFLFVS